MEAHYSPIFQSLESEVLFKCLMSRSHNLWNQSNQERKGYPRQVMFSFFGSLKHVKHCKWQCLPILNACWDSCRVKICMLFYRLVTFLDLQNCGILSMLESFVFKSRGKMYQLANALVRGCKATINYILSYNYRYEPL